MYRTPWMTANKDRQVDAEYERSPITWTDDDASAVCVEHFRQEGDLYKFTAAFP